METMQTGGCQKMLRGKTREHLLSGYEVSFGVMKMFCNYIELVVS